MIISEKQVTIARQEVTEIDGMLKDAAGEHASALRARLAELGEALDRYERLHSGGVRTFLASSLADLPRLLAELRLARGWTQRELAERLGVSEQMVQKDEAGGYGRATLARLLTITNIFDVEFYGCMTLRGIEPHGEQASVYHGHYEQFPIELSETATSHLRCLTASAGLPAAQYVEGLILREAQRLSEGLADEARAHVEAIRTEAEALAEIVTRLPAVQAPEPESTLIT